MKILVNYDPTERPHLSALAYWFKKLGYSPISTDATLSPAQLVEKARLNKCDAIFLCNTGTLRNCVPNAKATLDNYRGSKLNLSIPVIVGNKLAHMHTTNTGQFLIENDLNKFKTLYEKVPTFSFYVLKTVDTFADALKTIEESILVSYDIETNTFLEKDDDVNNIFEAGKTVITCCAWSCLRKDGTITTFVLPLINFTTDYWRTDNEYVEAIEFMQRANKTDTPKVMHNGVYDCTHTICYHAEPYNFVLDTMGLAHSEYSELEKTLDFVASLHLPDYCQWKDDADSASKEGDIRKYWGYNAKDTWHTLRIAISQLRNQPAYAAVNYADKFKLIYPSLYCAFEGFALDVELQNKLRIEEQKKLDESRSLLRVLCADDNFNPGSWQQVQKYIYKVFGAVHPKVGKSKSGTDEKNLLEVADQHPLLALVANAVLEYRGAQKAISTYLNYLKYNNRLLWNLNPFGTETDRMACNSSSFWCGTQVQNIPSYAKIALIADEGFELVECDNKQSEGRCTAYLAEEEALIKALEDPMYDFYKVLGTLFFNIPYENVTSFFRNKVLKKIVHGTNYMMGGKTFKENIGLKILNETASILGYKLIQKPNKNNPKEKTILAFSQELLAKYHVPFPKVKLWYRKIHNEILATHRLVSPLGHVRYFFGDISKDHNMLRSAVAHQPQNLSVKILNMGLWKIYKQLVVEPVLPLKLGDFRLKAQVHDSNLAQYKIEHRDYVVAKMVELMDNPVEVHGRILRIPVDSKVGQNWLEMK